MSEKAQTIRIYGTVEDSIVDGPGLRFALFTQGCSHRCPGCHNPESQPFEGGSVVSVEALEQQIIANKLDTGVTFSGGEPFEQCEACLELATRLKERGYNIWIYSGYTFEQLIGGVPNKCAPQLLALCDVLVDGPFVQNLHDYSLTWRGSSNQRAIDLKESFAQDKIILWQEYEEFPEPPRSW